MIDIFEIMKEFHTENNLRQNLAYYDGGMFKPPENRFQQIKEGRENNSYNGICVFKNGSTLCDRLVEDGRVHRLDIDEPYDLSTESRWFDFLENREDEDGVYVYEPRTGQLYRISKIKDMNRSVSRLSDYVPPDFVFYHPDTYVLGNPESMLRKNIGTKTRLAIDLPVSYPGVQAYQIKRSGYTPLGMGKVTHFNNNGLAREYFLHNMAEPGEMVVPEYGIKGTVRDYRGIVRLPLTPGCYHKLAA